MPVWASSWSDFPPSSTEQVMRINCNHGFELASKSQILFDSKLSKSDSRFSTNTRMGRTLDEFTVRLQNSIWPNLGGRLANTWNWNGTTWLVGGLTTHADR